MRGLVVHPDHILGKFVIRETQMQPDMTEELYFLFCESPIQPKTVDEDYEAEWIAARENDFGTLLFNFEDLTSTDKLDRATAGIEPNDKLALVIYRGWMLTPQQYAILYAALLPKNYRLINSVAEYRNCHYLPDSLRFIESNTPKTVFEPFDSENSIGRLIEKAQVFGQKPVILKDYVKSEKHDWETACFVKDASDKTSLKQTIENLVQLRGDYLNTGIVVREFVALNALTIHSKSGMPLTEEYRLFFYRQQLLGIYDYWEEGEYNHEKPDTTAFEAIALQIESNFFTMDIARQENGELIIIELGDGQVAGLPDKAGRFAFYKALRKLASD